MRVWIILKTDTLNTTLMMTCVVTTIVLLLPSVLPSGVISTISSLESSLNISKVMQRVNAQEETPSENMTNNKPQEETLSENMINNKPIAVAGPDQTVKSGDRVDLDGTESYDPDCQNGNDMWCTKELKYSWESAGNEVLGSDIPKSKVSFTAPSVHETTKLTFELWVEDDFESSDPDSLTITVEPTIEDEQQFPVADAGQDQTVGTGQEVHLDGTRSYPEGALKSIEWKQTGGPHVKLSDAHVLQPTFSAPSVDKSKKLTFELVVYGGSGSSKPDAVTIRVEPKVENGRQPLQDQSPNKSDITLNATLSKIKDLGLGLKQSNLSKLLPFAGLGVVVIGGAVAYGKYRSKKSQHKGDNVAVITRGGIE